MELLSIAAVLLGFLGLYTMLGILFLFLVRREIEHGPVAEVIAQR